MVNRLYRDGFEWTRAELSWPGGTRSWHCLAGRVFLKVHSPGRKVSSPGLWRWEASHQDDGRVALDGDVDTREAAMDAAVAAIGAVQDARDDALDNRGGSMQGRKPQSTPRA